MGQKESWRGNFYYKQLSIIKNVICTPCCRSKRTPTQIQYKILIYLFIDIFFVIKHPALLAACFFISVFYYYPHTQSLKGNNVEWGERRRGGWRKWAKIVMCVVSCIFIRVRPGFSLRWASVIVGNWLVGHLLMNVCYVFCSTICINML